MIYHKTKQTKFYMLDILGVSIYTWLLITQMVIMCSFFSSNLNIVWYNNYKILTHNDLDKRENILHHYLFEDKIIPKQMQPINMIMIHYWDKKLPKRLHVLEADRMTIKKKHWIDFSCSTVCIITGRVPNDCHCACLSHK